MTIRLGLAMLAAGAVTMAAPVAHAQQAPEYRVEASGRATSEVSLSTPSTEGAAPKVVRIDYGQPHARGRQVAGTLIPYDQVWRTGANQATSLRTDVTLEVGNLRVPPGSYTLYSQLSRDGGWTLIVNRQTGQWGTQYDQARDLGRVQLQAATVATPAESFSITLMPATDQPAGGALVLAWGTVRGTTSWRVVP